MDINTQICTTRQQTKRLLELGLKKMTADCYYAEDDFEDAAYMLKSKVKQWNDYYLPAWSLHRLIALCDGPVTINHESCTVTYGIELDFHGLPTIYDNLIDCIQWLIEEGMFNLKFLED